MKRNNFLDSLKKFIEKGENDYVALDLGAGFLKGIYVSDNQIKNFFVEKNKGKPIQLAANWLKREGLLSKPVKAAIKGQDTFIRYIPFPKIDKKALKQAFSYEISKFIPLPKEDVYFDISILDENYKSGEFFLFLALAKKELIDSLIKESQEAKLNLTEISLNNAALINLFLSFLSSELPFSNSSPQAQAPSHPDTLIPLRAQAGTSGHRRAQAPLRAQAGENVALVDIGLNSTLLNLINNGLPILSREVEVSTSNLLAKLSMGIDPPDTFEGGVLFQGKPPKIEEDAPGLDNTQEIKEAAEEVFFDLCEEIKNSFDYFELNWGQRIHKVFVTGGLSKLSGIDKIMMDSLGVETKVWNPFEKVPLNFDKNILNFKEMLAVVLGLSL
ncbi:MAG: pilus assembly protein PilM [Candidatus Omnitrophica bacterium]|nr:pilus assembly protein PilM [Candidatus Omnitrophota bacterium]